MKLLRAPSTTISKETLLKTVDFNLPERFMFIVVFRTLFQKLVLPHSVFSEINL